MDLEKQEFFRDHLQKQIAELLGDQEKTMIGMTNDNERLNDHVDQASFESDRNFELRIRDRERQLIAKMKEALQRIDDETYGICDDCGDEISEKRLIARPVTTLCINCKTKQEKNEKLRGRNYSREFTFRESMQSHQDIIIEV